MRRFPTILVAFAALLTFGLACDETDGPPDDPDYLPGTQVGSEGFMPNCDRVPVGDDELVPGFSDTPSDLAAKFLGTFAAGLQPEVGELVEGSLVLSFVEAEATRDDACPPAVMLRISGNLDLSPSVSAALAGEVMFEDGNAGDALLLGVDPSGDARPTTFDPAAVDVFRIRSEALLADGNTLIGPLLFEGCTAGDCTTETIGSLAATRP